MSEAKTQVAPRGYCAFQAQRLVAAGELIDVAEYCRQHQGGELIHIFDTTTGQVIDVDLRGSAEDVRAWLLSHYPQRLPQSPADAASKATAKKGRGRPKLGVVSREVTLLPRQWQWLSTQSGGASVTLRKLVDKAADDPQQHRQQAQQALYRFATALAGDETGFEEAMRALFADDAAGFEHHCKGWPVDVRQQALGMAQQVWPPVNG